MRSYVGARTREDLERFEGSAIAKLIERLRESGVPEKTLIKAASEVATIATGSGIRELARLRRNYGRG